MFSSSPENSCSPSSIRSNDCSMSSSEGKDETVLLSDIGNKCSLFKSIRVGAGRVWMMGGGACAALHTRILHGTQAQSPPIRAGALAPPWPGFSHLYFVSSPSQGG